MSCSRDTSTCLRVIVQMSHVLVHKCTSQTQEKGASVCCETLKTFNDHLTEKPRCNMWAKFKGGQKVGEGLWWRDRLIRKLGARWGQNGCAILHSKRGKSPGVGPWWKTVLSGDFLFLGVHILCASSQEQTQIWKKKRFIPVTLQLRYQIHKSYKCLCSFPWSFKIKIAFYQWRAISALPNTIPSTTQRGWENLQSGATSGELTQLQKGPVSSIWLSHLNKSMTAWRLQFQSTTDASCSPFELLSLNSWTQPPHLCCSNNAGVDVLVL